MLHVRCDVRYLTHAHPTITAGEQNTAQPDTRTAYHIIA